MYPKSAYLANVDFIRTFGVIVHYNTVTWLARISTSCWFRCICLSFSCRKRSEIKSTKQHSCAATFFMHCLSMDIQIFVGHTVSNVIFLYINPSKNIFWDPEKRRRFAPGGVGRLHPNGRNSLVPGPGGVHGVRLIFICTYTIYMRVYVHMYIYMYMYMCVYVYIYIYMYIKKHHIMYVWFDLTWFTL